MTLTHILVLSLFALLAGWAVPHRWRGWLLLVGSVLAIYWLQPANPIRNLDFWLPTASLALTVFVWAITRPRYAVREQPLRDSRASWLGALLILALVLAVGLTRYLGPVCCLTPSRPPDLLRVAMVLTLGSVAVAIPARLTDNRRFLPSAAILLILVLFVLLKSEPLALAGSAWLRLQAGQAPDLASSLDLRWLGFSYLAFRLLHALRDSQAGRLPSYSLGEFVTYAIFFPALSAGPIDRSQHFIAELRSSESQSSALAGRPNSSDLAAGAERLLFGLFKKFVLADTLALIALNSQNAVQVSSTRWMWVLLYAYGLRIYFDFSGYTDVALGIARLVGITLPENFEHPYRKQNLTAFWNSWHITLAQWFRAYFFNPVTRFLRTRTQKIPTWGIILVGQLGTMILIGLWHGITWSFFAWGAWHGVGLFAHNRWSSWARPRLSGLAQRPRLQAAFQAAGWLLTFHYVTLGWVLFALPSLPLAGEVFLKLAGK